MLATMAMTGLSLAAVLSSGYVVCFLLRAGNIRPLYERLSLWFLLGSCAVTTLVFWASLVCSTIAIPFAVALAMLALCYSLFRAGRCLAARRARWANVLASQPAGPRSILRLMIVSGLLIEIIAIAFATLSTDLGWDGIMNFGIKAKIFFLEGGVPLSYFSDLSRTWTHLNYPLLVPLMEAWVYRFAGQVDERQLMIIFFCFFLSLLGLFYAALRRRHSQLYSLVFAVILCATPFVLRMTASGYADLPLATLILAASIYLYSWLQGRRTDDLVLASVLAAQCVWVKREGLVFWLVCLAAVAAWSIFSQPNPLRQKMRVLFTYLVPVLVLAPWFGVMAWQQPPDTDFVKLGVGAVLANINRLPVLLGLLLRELSAVERWGVLWLLFLLVGLASRRRRWAAGDLFLLLGAATYLLVMASSYMLSSWPSYLDHAQASFDRLVFQVMPLALLFVALRWPALAVSPRKQTGDQPASAAPTSPDQLVPTQAATPKALRTQQSDHSAIV